MKRDPEGFIAWILWERLQGLDIDGGDLQAKAVEFGVLAPVKVTEPCMVACPCAENDNIPGLCFRSTPRDGVS